MNAEFVVAIPTVGFLGAVGFAIGLAHAKLPPAALGWYVGALLVAYAGLLIATSVWVAACTDCTSHVSYDSNRPVDLLVAIFWGGLFIVGIVLSTSAGVIISNLARKLR